MERFTYILSFFTTEKENWLNLIYIHIIFQLVLEFKTKYYRKDQTDKKAKSFDLKGLIMKIHRSFIHFL